MSALEPLQTHLYGYVASLWSHLLVLHGGADVDASRAAYDELAHGLVVHIEQYVAVQCVGCQVVHTVHAGLLIGCDERLQRAVHQVVGLHDGHDGRHAHAVVAAQGGAFGLHPFTVDVGLDGVCLKDVAALVGLLWHHVHVCLQYCCLAVFHARCGGLAHDDVLGIVLEGFYVVLLGPCEQEFLHLLKVSAGTGNLRKQVEVVPYGLWSQVFD